MNDDLKAQIVRTRLGQARSTLKDAGVLLDAGAGGLSVVNRAYYAAFYALLGLLQTADLTPRKHQAAISLFSREFIKPGHFTIECGDNLRELFMDRMKDDYDRTELVTRLEANHAIDLAVAFIGEVEAYLKSHGYELDDTNH